MKYDKNILFVVREMALYWNLSLQDEKKTLRFFRKISEIETVTLNSIDTGQLMGLFNKLKESTRGTDDSLKRQFEYVKRVFKYASSKGYIKRNPCDLLKLPKSSRAIIVSLTEAEVKLIETAIAEGTKVEKIKDWFLFQCYTGLAFVDFKAFNRSQVHSIRDRLYVVGNRQKRGSEYILPFTVKAVKLAEKYNYCFGCNCIQFYNRKLKDLQLLTGISKILTSHVARRTFGQLMLDDGVPLETVARMLGHRFVSTTERHYARVGIERVIRDTERMAA